jgi:hypothetical protein
MDSHLEHPVAINELEGDGVLRELPNEDPRRQPDHIEVVCGEDETQQSSTQHQGAPADAHEYLHF